MIRSIAIGTGDTQPTQFHAEDGGDERKVARGPGGGVVRLTGSFSA